MLSTVDRFPTMVGCVGAVCSGMISAQRENRSGGYSPICPRSSGIPVRRSGRVPAMVWPDGKAGTGGHSAGHRLRHNLRLEGYPLLCRGMRDFCYNRMVDEENEAVLSGNCEKRKVEPKMAWPSWFYRQCFLSHYSPAQAIRPRFSIALTPPTLKPFNDRSGAVVLRQVAAHHSVITIAQRI